MEQDLKRAISDVQERIDLWCAAGLSTDWLENVLRLLRRQQADRR